MQQQAEQALSIPASLWGILAVNALAAIGLLAKAILELAQQRKNGGGLKGNPHNPNGAATKEQMATVIAKLESIERGQADGVSRITRTLHDHAVHYAHTHLAVVAAEKLAASAEQLVKATERFMQKVEIRLDQERGR